MCPHFGVCIRIHVYTGVLVEHWPESESSPGLSPTTR